LFQKVRVKFAQVSKIGFMIFSQSYGKQAVSFCEVMFFGKSYFLQSQVAKIGFEVLAKVSASLVWAF